MQNGKEPNLRAKVFCILRDVEKRFGDRAEEQAVEPGLVLKNERVQFARQREHNMKVSCREKFLLSIGDPPRTRLGLAFGTVAVTAAIEGESAKITLAAFVAVSAQCRGAAAHDRAHHLHLLKTNLASMAVEERLALRTKNVGHLDGGPRHWSDFLLLDRFTISTLEIGRLSAG